MKYATSYFCFTSSVFYKDSQKQVTIEGHLATLALQIPTHPMQKQSLSLFFFSLAAFSLWQGRNFAIPFCAFFMRAVDIFVSPNSSYIPSCLLNVGACLLASRGSSTEPGCQIWII
jgi:hypothetical protein